MTKEQFKKFAKEEFGYDISFEKSDEPDTYESLFGELSKNIKVGDEVADDFHKENVVSTCKLDWWSAPYKRSDENTDRKEIDWISIDENVPTNGQRVLVCFNDGFILIGAYINYAEDEEDKEESFWVFDGEENFNLEDAQVIAWMPLPESYKAESEVEE